MIESYRLFYVNDHHVGTKQELEKLIADLKKLTVSLKAKLKGNTFLW